MDGKMLVCMEGRWARLKEALRSQAQRNGSVDANLVEDSMELLEVQSVLES